MVKAGIVISTGPAVVPPFFSSSLLTDPGFSTSFIATISSSDAIIFKNKVTNISPSTIASIIENTSFEISGYICRLHFFPILFLGDGTVALTILYSGISFVSISGNIHSNSSSSAVSSEVAAVSSLTVVRQSCIRVSSENGFSTPFNLILICDVCFSFPSSILLPPALAIAYMLSYKQKKKTRLLSSFHKMISSIFSTGKSYYLNGSVLLAGVGISIDGTSSCKSNNVGK